MANHSNRHVSDYTSGGGAADGLKAVVAGAGAVWMMDRFDWLAFNHEDSRARGRTERIRPGGMDPAHALAAKVARATGTHFGPAPAHQHPAGLAVHYAVPIGLAWLYLVLRRRWPSVKTGRGALYGATTFLVLDQLVNPMLGLAAHPRRYPWQRNAREMVAHMIYGVTVDSLLQAMTRIRPLNAQKARAGWYQPAMGR